MDSSKILSGVIHCEIRKSIRIKLKISQNLGSLTSVDLRSYWKREDSHFTPWLAQQENLSLLSEALSMNLRLIDTELRVGSYRADIVCEDVSTLTTVVIENQLTVTDHSHLGQVIAYAAGLEAHSMIWVAERFTPEHESAVQWLNTATTDEYSFFGVQIELWQIGNSEPAPRFDVVAKPNEWRRATRRATREGTKKSGSMYQDWKQFWTRFGSFTESSGSKYPKPVAAARNWLYLPWNLDGIKITASHSLVNTRSSVYVLINEDLFEQVSSREQELVALIGQSVRITEERSNPRSGGFIAIDEQPEGGEEADRFRWLNRTLGQLNDFLSNYRP
jgi:hypothetical protein